MGHGCRGILIHCIDFRFIRALYEFMDREGLLDHVDEGSWAGAAKELVDEEWRGFVFKQIDISLERHHISEVHLVQHIDCGAYGGSREIGPIEKERVFQEGQLEKARAVIAERYPNLTVYCYIAMLHTNGPTTIDRVLQEELSVS